MSKPLVIESEAEADIGEAFDWYELQRPGLGGDFMLCVEAALNAIAANPKGYAKVFENVRRVLVRRFPYFVLYVERREAVFVFCVLHTSRSPDVWRSRLE